MRSLLLLGLFVLRPASAHLPGALEEYTVVEDPTFSRVLVGEFDTGDEVYIVEMTFETGFAMPMELLIPVSRANETHRPHYAVVGPGFPEPTDEERAELPMEVPEGAGVFWERNEDAEREVYFEGTMRRTYWSSGTIAVSLAAGTHEVWIWSPEGSVGDFQLGFGVEENFSDGGIGSVFADWRLYAY